MYNIINEGGNARYIDRATGEDKGFAEKMDLHKISRTVLVDEMVIVLSNINDRFYKKFGEKLWNDFNVITNGTALNGSSASLFNKDITDEEFVHHKPKVGDIDITFPGELMSKLWELLNDLDDEKLGDFTTYLGHKKSNASPTEVAGLHQINAIFEINTGDYTCNLQIDFEASDYENDSPTDWASFSHNSDWDDIKAGFKGVAHKFTLLNLSRAQSRLDGIQVITPKNAEKIMNTLSTDYDDNKPIKLSTSKEYASPTNLAFSVSKGIRTKFELVYFKDDVQLIVDNKPVFYEKNSKNDNYETNLLKQFEMIFQKEPDGDDMKNFKSFVGLVKLMKKYSTKEIIEDFFFDQLVSKTLWCPNGCQGLERNNPEGDLEIKGAMVNYLYDEFPYLKKYIPQVDAKINEYYKNYRMIDVSEHFIPFGSKLSSIFEAVHNASLHETNDLVSEKRKFLLSKNIDKREIEIALRHPELHHNSIAMNDIIKKNKFSRDEERFLRTPIENESAFKQHLNNIKKRGY